MLAGFCEAYGMSRLRSYTTRPQRDELDVGHTFISDGEAASMPDRVAETTIGDTLYFMTREQVTVSDVIVIDPDGLYELVRALPDEDFGIVIVDAPTGVRRARYALRGSDGKGFDERDAQEAVRFDGFEDKLAHDTPQNVCAVYKVPNAGDGTEHLEGMAALMAGWNAGTASLDELDRRRHIIDWDDVDDGLPRHRVISRLYGNDEGMADVARSHVSDAWLAMAARAHCDDWSLADMMRRLLPEGLPEDDEEG